MGTDRRDASRRTTPASGTVREIRAGSLTLEVQPDDCNAVGPEDDGCLEVDFIRGRLSIDLMHSDDDRHAEGPADDFELDLLRSATRSAAPSSYAPETFDSGDDQVGPEVDLEHLEGDNPS